MKFKIGIFGSAADNKNEVLQKAHEVGEVLSKYKNKIILITGVADGLPHKVVEVASKNGVEVWGFSAGINLKSQKEISPNHDLSIYKKIFYVPANYPFAKQVDVCRKYRNVSSTATCDAGIIISGRWGTMNEFTNLHDLGKVIGVFTGTGGIADELPRLMKKIHKKSKAVVIFASSPNKLISKVINLVEIRA
ncbi:hypothetical protein HY357_00190 [Candidatus Roizmanbacteria bacterium]|nr:hypothetical protein [Candidatus Roizmanbacteria bacterium]